MARTNLLRMDDLLLRGGTWLALLWFAGSAVGLGVAANAGSGLPAVLMCAALAASAPLGMLAAGANLRRRERRAWALYRLVDDHVELPASDLLRDSDFTATTLDRAIRDLNNAGAAFLVWDRAADVVQDGRLRSARLEVDECGSCGAKVSLALRIGQAQHARCPFCDDPIEVPGLLEEKARLIEELDTDPPPRALRKRSTFSLGVFVVLLLIFWPLGVGYALWHWRALSPD